MPDVIPPPRQLRRVESPPLPPRGPRAPSRPRIFISDRGRMEPGWGAEVPLPEGAELPERLAEWSRSNRKLCRVWRWRELRVATKVGFHNFAKYEISRNTLLISQNFGKEVNFAKFCEIFPLPFFAKFIGTNIAKFRQGI
jgi:hypothetical protein